MSKRFLDDDTDELDLWASTKPVNARWLREEAVRYGRRGELSLNKCIECHGSREAFCNRCHEAVSLEPDCFGCHDYPR